MAFASRRSVFLAVIASSSLSLLLLSLVSVFNSIAIAYDIYERASAAAAGQLYPATNLIAHVLALGVSVVMLGAVVVVLSAMMHYASHSHSHSLTPSAGVARSFQEAMAELMYMESSSSSSLRDDDGGDEDEDADWWWFRRVPGRSRRRRRRRSSGVSEETIARLRRGSVEADAVGELFIVVADDDDDDDDDRGVGTTSARPLPPQFSECAVCRRDFAAGSSVIFLPCGHFFCHCVDRWLRRHDSCPYCRSGVEGKPPSPASAGSSARSLSRSLSRSLESAAGSSTRSGDSLTAHSDSIGFQETTYDLALVNAASGYYC